MKKGTRKNREPGSLRVKAENKLKSRKSLLDHMSDIDVRKLAHELQVHQIELEMQNEELRHSQEALEASRSKYADLYDYAPVGYFTLDKKGLIREANLTGAGLLGVDRGELINNPFSRFVQKEFQDVFYLHCGKVLVNPERQSCILRLKKNSGPVRYAQLESSLTRDEEGNSVIMTSLIDITKRMKAEEDRRYLLIELGRKNLELEQLIYITSHDLRSPLVNIEGYGSELNNSLKDVLSALEGEKVPMRIKNKISSIVNEDIAESVKVIHSSIFQMNRLISGILKYSRTGKTELTIEDIDVNKMMADIAENFKFRQKESATEMEISPLLSCRGDADQLNQLFSNLVDNAMKHCDPNRPCVIKIHGHKDRDHSVYCIEDNGVGIAPAHQEKIFKLFYKLDQGNVKGEGLGLTIAGRIVEMHNGKIWVESEPSKGSRFIVSLPAYEN